MSHQLQTFRYDQLMRRVGGMIGPGSKVAEVLPELFPVLNIEDPPGELLILGQTDLGIGAVSAPGVAATFTSVQLFNPVDSGKIITISSAVLSTGDSGFIRGSTFPTGGAGAASGDTRFRDVRRGELDRPTGEIRVRNIAGTTNPTFFMRVLGGAPVVLDDENSFIVLPAGFGWEFQHGTLDKELTCTYFWRERVALESETNFP